MSPDNQQQLFAAHPRAFRPPSNDEIAPLDSWGVECGDGWLSLITQAAELIEADIDQIRNICEWPRVAQIKEKLGELRIYMNNAHPTLVTQVLAVANQSSSICEQCGQLGTLHRTEYLHTSCDACEANRAVEPPDLEAGMHELDQVRQILAARPGFGARNEPV
ncbi:MAG: hypothetical protein HYU74_10115 [Dechloromonas sp.]|nr:hypothetical protein [Dechloromonas sp.]